MSEADLIGALVIGFAAGVASGLLGIGGGALFVPGLVFFLGETQLTAEATSLVAIVPVALVGTLRQRSYGNLKLREGMLIGFLSLPGAAAGALLADMLPERALELSFAAVQLFFAYQLARRALRPREPGESEA